MIIVGIDTETTGLEPSDEIVEIGYHVYDTDANVILSSHSNMFSTSKWGEEAAKFHGIPQHVASVGSIRHEDLDLYNLLSRYDPSYIIAHHAEFDYKFIVKTWPKLDKTNFKWLCSQNDLPHEQHLNFRPNSYRLMHLALDYKFPVVSWHRALVDAEYVVKIASCHDLDAAYDNAKSRKTVISVGGKYNYDYVSVVKNMNFRWFEQTKRWISEPLRSKAEIANLTDILNKSVPNWSVLVEDIPNRIYL